MFFLGKSIYQVPGINYKFGGGGLGTVINLSMVLMAPNYIIRGRRIVVDLVIVHNSPAVKFYMVLHV